MKSFITTIALILLSVCSLAAQVVQVVQTTPDLHEALEKKSPLQFGNAFKSKLVINVQDDKKFQEIDGFGASMTDSSAWLLYTKLDRRERDLAMRDLFDPKDGIGLSFLRQPIGASDLSLNHYTYDEVGQAQGDPTLQHFSISHDEEYILPLLRQALKINPAIKVVASPWSAPGWMKSSGSMVGGSVKREFYESYADYFVKFIRSYEAAGIPIYGLTMQNEPLYVPKDYPGAEMKEDAQGRFLRENLGPALRSANLNLKVMVYDHNWDHPEYPIRLLSDRATSQYAAGTAFHCYGGDVSAQSIVHQQVPQKDIWETECSGGTWQNGNLLVEGARLIIGATRNWARSVVLWGVALDQNHGPNKGGCDTCRGVVTVETNKSTPTYTKTVDFYTLGHVSKFVRPGAFRVDSSTLPDKLESVAFRNTDGTVALFVLNPTTASTSFEVSSRNRAFEYTLPPGSVATFSWSAQ